MTVMLLVLLALAGGGRSVEPGRPMTHFVGGRACPMEFDFPSDWVAASVDSPDYRHERCRVEVTPKDLAKRLEEVDVDVYTIEVVLPKLGLVQDFLDAARDYFTFRHGKWYVKGRQGMLDDASVITQGQWVGLEGVATIGCSHANGGGYSGLCEAPVVVMDDEEGNVWAMYGGADSEPAFTTIKDSFSLRAN